MSFRHQIALIILVLYSFLVSAESQSIEPQSILYNGANKYSKKWVFDENNIRCLSFVPPPTPVVQSCIDLNQPELLLFNYTRMFFSALYIKPEPKKILIIGLGGGSFPQALMKILPNTEIDIVEIDQDIITIAEKYFLFKPNNNVTIFTQDGFDFVQKAKDETYDLIFIDAFTEDYVPPNFLTTEFVANIKKILTKTGIVVINSFGTKSKYYQLESDLYQKAFTNVINLTTGNMVIIATNDQLPSHTQIIQQAEKWKTSFEQINIPIDWLLDKFGFKYMRIILPLEHGLTVKN